MTTTAVRAAIALGFTALVATGTNHRLLVPLIILVVLGEWWIHGFRFKRRPTKAELIEVLPAAAMGVGALTLVSLMPMVLSQVVLVVAYGYARYMLPVWLKSTGGGLAIAFGNLTIITLAILLYSTVREGLPSLVVIMLLWGSGFALVYTCLIRWGEPQALLLASAWALVTAELAWICLTWMVSYVAAGGLIIVPQAALAIMAMTYFGGSLYAAQRRGELTSSRLREYVFVLGIVIAVLMIGTPWKAAL